MTDNSKQQEMCEDCKKLVGAGRYSEPHFHLVHKGEMRVSSIMGAADETYYVCEVCGYKWLHETGSCGMGWVA